MRYALIVNGVVATVTDQDESPIVPGNWIACGNAGPGHLFDGSVFTAPDPVAAPRHISVGSFFDRFGALKYPILASADASVKALIQDCSVRRYIDLDSAQLPYGLDMLIASGFAIDKTAILLIAVTDAEKA